MRKTVFVIFLLSLFMLISCNQATSEKIDLYEENLEIIGEEKAALLENLSETTFDMSDRSNAHAESLEIPVVENGKQYSVPEGRYYIYGELAGNVYIHDEDGDKLFQANLFNIPSITVDLNETHVLSFDGLDEVFVIPVETDLSPEFLTPGIWTVGTDIEAGSYMTEASFGLGYLQIFGPHDHHEVYELNGENTSEVHLKDGQTIKIADLAQVFFTLID